MHSLEQLSPEQIKKINDFLSENGLRPFEPRFIELLSCEDFCANVKEVGDYNFRGKISESTQSDSCPLSDKTRYILCLVSGSDHQQKGGSLLLDINFAPLQICRAGEKQ